MTETARTYAIVLYELGIPVEMVREAVKLLKENPELPEVLNSPVVPLKSKHAVIEKVFREPEFSALMVRFLKKACDAGCIGQRRLQKPVTPMPEWRQVLWMPSFTMLPCRVRPRLQE